MPIYNKKRTLQSRDSYSPYYDEDYDSMTDEEREEAELERALARLDEREWQ